MNVGPKIYSPGSLSPSLVGYTVYMVKFFVKIFFYEICGDLWQLPNLTLLKSGPRQMGFQCTALQEAQLMLITRSTRLAVSRGRAE